MHRYLKAFIMQMERAEFCRRRQFFDYRMGGNPEATFGVLMVKYPAMEVCLCTRAVQRSQAQFEHPALCRRKGAERYFRVPLAKYRPLLADDARRAQEACMERS
jgi:hypothetical protein